VTPRNAVPIRIDMDDGNFPIARTALLTLSKTRLAGSHRAVIDVVWAETYGWFDESSPKADRLKKRRTSARLSLRVFIEATWMNKSQVSRAINELVRWGILRRDRNSVPFTYSFNVHVDQWSQEVFRVTNPVNSSQDRQQLSKRTTVARSGVAYPDNPERPKSPAPSTFPAPLKKQGEDPKETGDPPLNPPQEDTEDGPGPVAPATVLALWNDICAADGVLPRALKLTPGRRKHIWARSREPGRDEAWWCSYFSRIRGSPFCCGENDRRWLADIDFAVRSEDVVTRVCEGKYDRTAGGGNGGRTGAGRRRHQGVAGANHAPSRTDWESEPDTLR